MFTGIIETVATITGIIPSGSNLNIWLQSSITAELKIDQSVAHNGVCLTVVAIEGERYMVTAVAETIIKTNVSAWQVGDKVNLERSLRVGDRLDGHFVQGHVDATGICTNIQDESGSKLFSFEFPEQYAALVIEKGSVCINGVSLTAFNVRKNSFTVTIIPYTLAHTNFKNLNIGNQVNLEFDILGKYFLRKLALQA